MKFICRGAILFVITQLILFVGFGVIVTRGQDFQINRTTVNAARRLQIEVPLDPAYYYALLRSDGLLDVNDPVVQLFVDI